jgi:DNA-binding phage protein
VLADTTGLSRQQLSIVLARYSQPRPQTIKALLQAIMALEKEWNDVRIRDTNVIVR